MTLVAEPASERRSEPAWDIARLFPDQGDWSEDDYLTLDCNRLVEFCDGTVDVLPMPSLSHQLILQSLFQHLKNWIQPRKLGLVVVAPYPIRVGQRRYREPDLAFLSRKQLAGSSDLCADGAELVMEIVSPSDPRRDLEIKRREYAQAGIPEYWIVDPRTRTITVLTLRSNNEYMEHGEFKPGDVVTSVLLAGFEVDVSAVFAEADLAQSVESD